MNYITIGEIAEFINGHAFKPNDWESEGRRIIRIQNLTDSEKPFNRTTKSIPEKYLIRKGDLLVSWSATLGVFEWLYEDDALLNQHIFKAVLNASLVEKRYFMYVLRYTLSRMIQFTHGSTMKHIVRSDFIKHKIPLPTLEEQQKMISKLDKASSIIQKRKESLKYLDLYLRSMFLEMFGDPITNQKKWDKKELRFFGEIITGNTPPRNNPDNYTPNYFEWIKTDNILFNKMYITRSAEYLSQLGLQKGRLVKSGAVLVACIAGSLESIGRSAITDRNVSFNQQINAIQPNKNVNSYFLYWLVKLSKKYIQSHATKGMKKILTKGDFEKILMILPPIDLQDKFADEVRKIENVKQKMLTQDELFETQFQAQMQKSFNH